MSQASSSIARTRRSARVAPLAVVRAIAPLHIAADVEPMEDDVTGLPLIMCPDCRDVRVFAATTMQYKCNNGKRYFKCPRKKFSNASAVGKCKSYWFEEEYVVYLHDNGYLLAAGSTIAEALTTEVPEVVGKIDSLEKNLKKVKEMVGKNREGIGSCICLVCGCVNVTLFLVLEWL
ncbi:unnamed protein product [Miscanthus lutarioriparius]|uniref:Uncharacterized protein n=1 Tax=Miscanthus lutarioriparius TaxID=422564 RepID=A0A811RH51_9POAL|nr:unnamed protein product [Miscanthus lutarioriparius]